jgi:matrixin
VDSKPISVTRGLAGRVPTAIVVAAALAAAVVTTVSPASAVSPRTATPAVHPTEVTAAFPWSAKIARVRAKAAKVIKGRVAGDDVGGRLVQVQSHGANGTWVTLADTRTKSSGAFRVAAPTWWVAMQTLRVYVPATSTSTAATSTNTVTIKVTRSAKVRPGTAYQLADGASARWNPCQVITYRINTRLMPGGAPAELKKVFAQVSAATGLRFAYVGSSTYVPFAKDAKKHPTNADIVLAWATPKTAPVLAGANAGRGGVDWVRSGGIEELHNGGAVFDAAQQMSPIKSVQRRLIRQLYLHEVGHIIGLDHVADKRQLMYPTMQRTADPHYGAGDLAGLAVLGASRGCNNAGAR